MLSVLIDMSLRILSSHITLHNERVETEVQDLSFNTAVELSTSDWDDPAFGTCVFMHQDAVCSRRELFHGAFIVPEPPSPTKRGVPTSHSSVNRCFSSRPGRPTGDLVTIIQKCEWTLDVL